MHACIHTYGLESAVSGSVFVVVVVGAALGNCCDDEARFNEDSRYLRVAREIERVRDDARSEKV